MKYLTRNTAHEKTGYNFQVMHTCKRPDNSNKSPKLPSNSVNIHKTARFHKNSTYLNVEIQIWNTDLHIIIVPVLIRVLKVLFEIQTDVGK